MARVMRPLTTYYHDYQGVRLVVMDGTSALDLGSSWIAQTEWLDARLAEAPGGPWKSVLFHQPIFHVRPGPGNPPGVKRHGSPCSKSTESILALQGTINATQADSEAGRKAGVEAPRRRGDCRAPVYHGFGRGVRRMYGPPSMTAADTFSPTAWGRG